jgi:hypothetical protein
VPNVLGKLNTETAVTIRAALDGLAEHEGFKLLRKYWQQRIQEYRSNTRPVQSDEFSALNAHNRPLHHADAIEGVLDWVQDAMEQCDTVIKGGKK